MRGPAGVLDLFAHGRGWLRRAAYLLEASRQRRQARQLARAAERRARGSFHRNWIEAEVSARLAVRSGVRAEDFLRSRVARYAATLPVPLEELGIDVRMENGEPMIRIRSSRAFTAGPAAGAADPAPDSPEMLEARAQLASHTERVASARARLDALAHAVAEDLASGKLPATPGQIDASLEQCGRPPVPHPAPPVLLRSLSLALLAAAAYRMAGPALAVAGLSADDLAGAFAHDRLSTVAGLMFGVGAAVAVYTFLDVAVERWHDILRTASAAHRPMVLGVAGASAILLSGAVALAAIRPGLMAGPLLLVCVPLAAVLLLRKAGQLEAEHGQASAAALEWDRSRARDAGERARRGEGVASAEAVLAAALRDHAVSEHRLRALENGKAELTRQEALVAGERARRMERMAESLAAGLELDRYAFIRRTAALALEEAPVRPIRSRPAAIDSGVGGRLEAAR